MKAVVITRPGGPEVLEIQDRPEPRPGSSQVRIRVLASGLNRADVSQRLGRYPAPPGVPADIPGLEYAGEIDMVGDGATMWSVGDRVMGIVSGGSHAEYVSVHEREVIAAPHGLGIEECAAIPEVFITAYDAIFSQLRMGAGESLLIHAAGSGVGTAAVQLAKIAGVKSVGTSRSPDKLHRASELGLDTSIVVQNDDWPAQVRAATDGKGADGVLDLVGGAYFKGNIEAIALRGRMIIVGLTAGSSAEIDLRRVMQKRMTIAGTLMRSRQLEEKIQVARTFSDRIVPMFDDRRLKPVVDRIMRFADIREAHRIMESNENFGKIVLAWG
ncbi:MAG TPA: NAD(P)H-quinone oxidoreductase [Gemmatimonadaceae bacterium]